MSKIKNFGKAFVDAVTTNMSKADLASAPISERLIKKRLNPVGFGLLTAGTVVGMTANHTIGKEGNAHLASHGKIAIEENLDRLISIDGSGFVKGANNIAQGNPEVMKSIVDNTFDNPNQWGASGDLVFALHNMREG